MKKPIVGLFVQMICVLFVFGNGSEAAVCILNIGDYPVEKVFLTLLINVVVVGLSIFIFRGIQQRGFNSKIPVSLYLWFVLLKYPVINALRSAGLHLPGPVIEDDQLVGAAIAELLRYVLLLVLIMWSGFSKKLTVYFQEVNNAGNMSTPPTSDEATK
ncbi:hypothetical protein [Hahella sp. HN01]|uniref:hypothetical protein n=1 Tax=Hahella sp. HN01 TaxID=2847262 RepID=UPI001C1F12D9|nr:hypothetical protein [Hahella sp. HN01]MBU6953256.1 hypothetical protein [Hahella sp. HN01]